MHLVTEHRDTFQTGSEAATYVAGIYEASDDSTFMDSGTNPTEKERYSSVYCMYVHIHYVLSPELYIEFLYDKNCVLSGKYHKTDNIFNIDFVKKKVLFFSCSGIHK